MSGFKIMRGTVFSDPQMSFFVRSTGHFHTFPPDKEKTGAKNFCELFWCIKGSGTFRLNEESHTLSPGEVWYYPPGSFHDYFPGKEGFHYCWVTLDGPDAATLIEGTGVRPGLNFGGSCPTHLFALIAKLLPVSDKKTQMVCLTTAFEIMTRISPEKSTNVSFDSLAFAAKCSIDANYTQPDFSVEQLAAERKVHRSTLNRIFHSAYNMTVHNYLIHCRLKYAETLLRDSDTPIAEIAQMAGFSSAAYFSKVFSGYIGITPGNYRRRNQTNGRFSQKNPR